MVNALERPTSGKIFVEDKDIGSLSAKELRSLRKGIGMIFQQFNLLESKTIYDNVAIALKLNGTPKKDIKTRVNELLEFVEPVSYTHLDVYKRQIVHCTGTTDVTKLCIVASA